MVCSGVFELMWPARETAVDCCGLLCWHGYYRLPESLPAATGMMYLHVDGVGVKVFCRPSYSSRVVLPVQHLGCTCIH